MHIVFRGNDFAEAHIVASMLEGAGIKAHVGGHFLQGALGEFGLINTTDVRVELKDIEQANVIVQEYDGKQTKRATQKTPLKNSRISQIKSLSYSLLLFIGVVVVVLIVANL